MRKLVWLLTAALAITLAGCSKPADKRPSPDGAPVTNTPPPVGKAGEAAENLPKSKQDQQGDRAPAGGAAGAAQENLPGQAAPAGGPRGE